jgi:hypothetical protein
MITLLINLIIYLLVVGILYWLVMYVIDAIPLPQPANRIAKIVVTVLVVLVILLLLLQVAGVDLGPRLPAVAPKP